jgi:hypothetical protein
VYTCGLNATNTGTATSRTVATTNAFTMAARIGYVSASSTNQTAGLRHGAQQFLIGTSVGGFDFRCRCGVSASVSTLRFFVGLWANTTIMTATTDPGSNTNLVGFGYDAADTSMTFFHNAASTTTKDALTGTFPVRDANTTLYEFRMFSAPNVSTIYYSIEVLQPGGGGAYYESSTSTNIPTSLLSPIIHVNNASTATAVGVDIVNLTIETFI